MYIVRPVTPHAVPVFSGKTFGQAVRWCLAAQREGKLEYDIYQIIGADSRLDDPELIATFEPERRGAASSSRDMGRCGTPAQ